MTWGKVDDNLAFHPKVIIAGNEAMGLWVRALSWSAQQLTDGVIPEAIIQALHGQDASQALVGAGLWHEVAGGYEFNDWADYQPTREQVLAEREAARERSKAARAKAAAARGEKTPVKAPAASQPRSRPTRLPDGFAIDAEMREWAKTEVPYFDIDKETRVFIDYWQGKATNATKLDWAATWRNWMRKAYSESPAAKIDKPIAPEVQEKLHAERRERIAQQLEERRLSEERRKNFEEPPKCEHGKNIAICAACWEKQDGE